MCSINYVSSVTFIINGMQVEFDSEIDASIRYRLKHEDDYAVRYIKELISNECLVLNEDLHAIHRLDGNECTILYESEVTNNNSSDVEISNPTSLESPSTSSSSSQSLAVSIEWSVEETRLLLDKYEKYLNFVGPMKKFKNKKLLWLQISDDLQKIFKVTRTAQQVENRYKTVMKRKKKATDENKKTGNVRHSIEYEQEISRIASIDDSIEPEILRGVNVVVEKPGTNDKKMKIQKSPAFILKETLLEITKQKEEAKEKRHREKMNILQNLIEAIHK